MVELLWILGISLFISSLCSVLEAVLLSVTHSYVEVLKDQGSKAGHYLHVMKQKIDEPIAAILTLNTIAHTAGATLGGWWAVRVFGAQVIVGFTIVLTLVLLTFSEIIPKTIGATYWKQLGAPAAHVLWWMVIVMKPILIPLNLFSQLLRGKKGSTVSRAELEVLAEIGYSEGTIDEDEWQVVTNVMGLGEVTLGEVMTPRTDMVAISLESTVEAAIGVMLDEGHLRLPVYSESIDKIEGLLVARDLWRAHRDGVTEISQILRPIQFLPTTKLVEDLIPEMRDQRAKMAIVIDEFGGTAGLVTLEDLIEEIVGEIQDEHEEDEPLSFEDLDDGTVRIWGGVAVREVNDRLDLEISEEPHDTLGGYVFGVLNRIGRVGDVVELENAQLRITQMRGRRVEYVVLVRDAPLTDEAGTG
ncbi:MAG: HlyC/CorC family transporter [Gemmatimonadetes bacterium]|nr:HlyC/CorC family transporter [Gemmatimonadota bacterium]